MRLPAVLHHGTEMLRKLRATIHAPSSTISAANPFRNCAALNRCELATPAKVPASTAPPSGSATFHFLRRASPVFPFGGEVKV